MGISAMLLSLEGGEETMATATAASIATATASAVAPPPAPQRARCGRRQMLASPPSMPTSGMHAVVARRRRGDGDRCWLPPAPQRARCCRHRRRPAVGHRAQARCCRRRRRSLAKPSEDTVLVRPTRTGSPPRSRRRRRPLSAPPRASTSAMLSSPDAVGAAVDTWLSQVKTQC